MANQNKKPEFFVDNDRYDWDGTSITGQQIRDIASIPDDVDLYQKVPGKPDRKIERETVVNLDASKAPERFSTQAPGSQAG